MRVTLAGVLAAAFACSPGIAQTRGSCATASGGALPDPASVTTSATANTALQNVASLYECALIADKVKCYMTYTRKQAGSANYDITPQFLARSVLIDNFHEPHKALKAYVCSGRGQAKVFQSINLAANDTVWVLIEFDGGAPGIDHARVFYPNDFGATTIEFGGPVVNAS